MKKDFESIQKKSASGITLIALIVTIVVLIILATISINIAINSNIITRSQQAASIQGISTEAERLEMVKGTVAIDNKGRVPIDKYIDQLIEEGITTPEEIKKIRDDGSSEFTTDTGYTVLVEPNGDSDVKITVEGPSGALPVRIGDIKLETGVNSIKVEAEFKRAEGAKIKFFYRKAVPAGSPETEVKGHDGKTCEITGLEENVRYIIRVEATNDYGTVSKEAVGRTGTIPDATGAIQPSDLQWNNEKASIKISKTTEDDLEIQYRIKNSNGEIVKNFEKIENGGTVSELELYDVVEYWLWDGLKGGSTGSFTVSETTPPDVIVTKIGGTTKSITVKVTATDGQAGMPINPEYSYYIRKMGEEYPTKASYTGLNTTYTFNNLAQAEYEIKVVTMDRAKNSGEGKISNVTLEAMPGGETEGSQVGAIEFIDFNWNKTEASVAVRKTINEDYEIQYRVKNASGRIVKDYAKIDNGGTITGLKYNYVVEARLTDGINFGNSGSFTVGDTIKPNDATVSFTAMGMEADESIEATVTLSDDQSGVNTAKSKWVFDKKSGEIGETASLYTGGTFSSSNKITLKAINQEDGNYYLHILTTDNANNTKETIEGPIKVGDAGSVAAIPNVAAGMTPVKWNGTNWEKTTKDDPEWYNYGTSATTRKWANVVLGEAQWTTSGGKQILNESQPYSQLVWIPRYAYKITSQYHNGGNVAGDIKIKFVNTSNADANGATYSENYPSTTTGTTGAMSDYVVHPAFNFGSSKLSGIWVGKYESSFQGTGTTAASGQANDPSKTMMIKAGVSSWRSITIDNMYKVCLAMNNNSRYGLSSSDSVVDPHLMKNDEWGAVAYLSKSKYGKYNEEVRINNNSNYITGNGASSDNEAASTTINAYSTTNGQKASTTGNVYGVYDMSGGAWEYVAGYVNNGHQYITDYGASLKTATESTTSKKYVNRYYSTTTSGANTQEADYAYANPSKATGDYKHYGDAVWETSSTYSSGSGSWYNDYSYFPCSSDPFFIRGGYCSNTSHAGVFNFYNTTGHYDSAIGFRVVVPVL